jgi:hypothetical protein
MAPGKLYDSGHLSDRRMSDVQRAAAPRSSAHLFSWPTWYPLRDGGASSSCAKTNCPGVDGAEHFHGKWAIDFNVPKTDGAGRPLDVPVFAAGHGIAYIGGRAVDCSDPSITLSTRARGNWAWIDHGGGLVTLYYHLDSFAPNINGAVVTPRTRIGNAGSTNHPCNPDKYLHYEVKTGGIRGESVDMGPMNACISGPSGNVQVQLPGHLGLEDEHGDVITDWDHLPTRPGVTMPATNKNCVSTAPPATFSAPAAPAADLVADDMRVSWAAAPAGAVETMIGREQWSATLNGYRPMTYHPADPDVTSQLFTDTELGGRYRFSVAHRNAVGWSNWSATTEIAPALPPQRPIRVSVSSGLDWIRFDWARPANNGTPVTGYEIERQIGNSDGTWGSPELIRTTASDVRWNDLEGSVTYRLRVRALSAAGPSGWTTARDVTTVAPEPPNRPASVTTNSGRTWISVNWARPANNGAPVTGYVVAWSAQRRNGTWAPWVSKRTPESSMRWNDLTGPQTFKVKIRALSSAGPSRWAPTRTVSSTW